MTLLVYGIDKNGAAVSLGEPLELTSHAILTRPWEEMTLVTLPGDRAFDRARVVLDGATIFEGLVLEQTNAHRAGGFTKLTCRTEPGYLLEENQINPYAYFQVTGESIVEEYAEPFGVAGVRLDENLSINIMLVSERESYWDYLTSFFVQAYGKALYLRRDNFLELSPYTGRHYRLSPSAEEGIPYLEYREKKKVGTITKVWFYTGEDSFGNLYEESFENPLAPAGAVPRELYLNPTRTWVTEHERYAHYLFYKSMIDAESVEVTLSGFHNFEPGDRVTLETPEGNKDLYVGENRITANKNGILTTARLWLPGNNLLA